MVNPLDLSHVHLPVDGLKIKATPAVAPVPVVPAQTLQVNDALSAGSKRPERRSSRPRRQAKQAVLLDQRHGGDRREHRALVSASVTAAVYQAGPARSTPSIEPVTPSEDGPVGSIDLKA